MDVLLLLLLVRLVLVVFWAAINLSLDNRRELGLSLELERFCLLDGDGHPSFFFVSSFLDLDDCLDVPLPFCLPAWAGWGFVDFPFSPLSERLDLSLSG